VVQRWAAKSASNRLALSFPIGYLQTRNRGLNYTQVRQFRLDMRHSVTNFAIHLSGCMNGTIAAPLRPSRRTSGGSLGALWGPSGGQGAGLPRSRTSGPSGTSRPGGPRRSPQAGHGGSRGQPPGARRSQTRARPGFQAASGLVNWRFHWPIPPGLDVITGLRMATCRWSLLAGPVRRRRSASVGNFFPCVRVCVLGKVVNDLACLP